jgi:hypothetical protein
MGIMAAPPPGDEKAAGRGLGMAVREMEAAPFPEIIYL